MSETGDYTPAPHWAGHNFATARRAYDDHAAASYSKAVSSGVDAKTLVPEEVSTESESPLIIACDVTGSMKAWPATIFSKLPYLEHEGKEYLGDDFQICFAAIGDAFSDKYALQVQPFAKGTELKDTLDKLIIEGGGGGTSQESYDLAALYFDRKVNCPKAIRKPMLIIIGDEGIYNFIDESKAETFCRVKLEQKIAPKEVFDSLKKKFCVYVIRKPYNCSTNNRNEDDIRIQSQWEDMLGADHVVALPEADRVVDVIFGILAEETGRRKYFEKELKDRQLPDKDGSHKVDVVLTSLRSIHNTKKSVKKLANPDAKGRSITKRKEPVGKKSISLLDDE